MTAREQIQAKPKDVQIVIKAYMTKRSLEDDNPDYEAYAEQALVWWDQRRAEFAGMGQGLEPEVIELFAARIIARELRKQGVWGKVLASGTCPR